MVAVFMKQKNVQKCNKRGLTCSDCAKCIYWVRNSCRGVPIEGFATGKETKKIFAKHPEVHKSFVRKFEDLNISSIGFGSNKPTFPRFSEEYKTPFENSVREYIECGGNIIDTALDPIYMGGWSERLVGRMIYKLISQGKLNRKGIVIISKGLNSHNDFRRDIEKSLQKFNFGNIDIYLIHDNEMLFVKFGYSEAKKIIKEMFLYLEQSVDKGKIRYYGISIGDHHLVDKRSLYVNLEDIYDIAESVGGTKHHFKVIEFPLNIVRPEACLAKDQKVKNSSLSLLEAADELKMNVITTETVCRGSVPNHHLLKQIQGSTLFQKELQLMRSLPHVKASLFGSINTSHVRENMGVRKMPVMNPKKALNIFSQISKNLESSWWIKKAIS